MGIFGSCRWVDNVWVGVIFLIEKRRIYSKLCGICLSVNVGFEEGNKIRIF